MNALAPHLGGWWLSASSASFPLGKFLSTLFVSYRCTDPRASLVVDAWLLIAGSLLVLLPSPFFLCVGRFIMGAGTGIGFVCMTAVLFELLPFDARPPNFFVLGLAFALGSFLANAVSLLSLSLFQILMLTSLLTFSSGILYLWLRPRDEYSMVEGEKAISSSSPRLLIYVLMALNVSIGVPVLVAYSSLVLEFFSLSTNTSNLLALLFPLLQITLILFLHQHRVFDRRVLIVGGFGVCLFVHFLLLLTASAAHLPIDHFGIAMSVLVALLAVFSSVPCNAALVLITEQFTTSDEQMLWGGRGRALMWALSAFSLATFLPSLYSWGFVAAFMPYSLSSLLLFVLVLKLYPRDDKEASIEPSGGVRSLWVSADCSQILAMGPRLWLVLLLVPGLAKRHRSRHLHKPHPACGAPPNPKDLEWTDEGDEDEATGEWLDEGWTPPLPEPALCHSFPDIGSQSSVMQRSLCPWQWRVNHDENREPRFISEAFCLCRRSRGGSDSFCLPIKRDMPILKKVLCDAASGRFEYVKTTLRVTVGCHSVLPRTQRASGVSAHYRRDANREV